MNRKTLVVVLCTFLAGCSKSSSPLPAEPSGPSDTPSPLPVVSVPISEGSVVHENDPMPLEIDYYQPQGTVWYAHAYVWLRDDGAAWTIECGAIGGTAGHVSPITSQMPGSRMSSVLYAWARDHVINGVVLEAWTYEDRPSDFIPPCYFNQEDGIHGAPRDVVLFEKAKRRTDIPHNWIVE